MYKWFNKNAKNHARDESVPEGPEDMPGHYYFDQRLKDAPIDPMGYWPLKSLDIPTIIAARKSNFASFSAAIDTIEAVTPLFASLPPDAVPLCYPILVEDRDRVADRLTDLGVPATRWWSGTHSGLDLSGFQDAQRLKDQMICLPLHQNLDHSDIGVIADALRSALRH